MTAMLIILAVAVALGVTARRFGPWQELLLLAGIIAAVSTQYLIFGPS
jgi:hypothetical protein